MTDKTFTRAGVSTNNGKTQYRFTNDLQRETVLSKNGHTNIEFYELGSAMTKEAAALFLAVRGITQDVPAKTAPKATAQPRKAKEPTRKADEQILDKLRKGELEYDDADDDFVEPKDERVQVAMSRLARQYPGMSADNLLKQVQMTFNEFGDYEPNF
jgi:hypothetical protein